MTHRTLVIVLISTLSLLIAPKPSLAQGPAVGIEPADAGAVEVTEPPSDEQASKPRRSRKVAALSLAHETSAPKAAAALSKRSKPGPLTWADLNSGFFINPALVGHIGQEVMTSGIGMQLDLGYQLGFGLGVVGHTEYTMLFPEVEGVSGHYLSVGGGLRFAAPVFSWLRLWIQGTYGVAGYLFEDDATGDTLASTGWGTSLGLRGGIDVHISGTKRGDHLFVGVSGGVDYNRFDAGGSDDVTEYAKKIAISVTYIL
jgi:hypothetical protein